MRHIARLLACGLAVFGMWLSEHSSGLAQEEVPGYSRPYRARDASEDAYRRGELRRRADVAGQVGTIQYVRWLNGLPPTVPHFAPQAVDRAAYYAFGMPEVMSGRSTVFERWPYLPGDIWGFVYDCPAPQSIGQRQIQTGPHRWQSFPVYREVPRVNPVRSGPRSY